MHTRRSRPAGSPSYRFVPRVAAASVTERRVERLGPPGETDAEVRGLSFDVAAHLRIPLDVVQLVADARHVLPDGLWLGLLEPRAEVLRVRFDGVAVRAVDALDEFALELAAQHAVGYLRRRVPHGGLAEDLTVYPSLLVYR